MKRRLLSFLLLLVFGFHAPAATFAAISPAAEPDCHTAGAGRHPASPACCPDTGLHASCCPAACVSAAGLTVSWGLAERHDGPLQTVSSHSAVFSSRGESPLIRPPIL